MFKGLETMTTSISNNTELFEDLLIDSLENSIEVKELQSEIHDLITTSFELEHLYKTIEKNGITTSLLSLINHDGMISKVIPEIPSLESFTKDLSVNDSKAALEGIAEVLKTIYKKTIGKIAKLISHVITSIKIRCRSVPAMRLRVDNYTRDISGKEFNTEKAHKILGKFNKYSDLLELLDHAINSDKVVMELLHMELPTSEDAFVKMKAELEAFKKKYESIYRIFNVGFKYTVHSEMSLIDAGYTAESFHAIASKIDDYIRATLACEAETNRAWDVYYDTVDKLLEEMSATYEDRHGNEQTALTKVGHMLIEISDMIADISLDIYDHAYRDGPIKAFKTLGKLKEAYT